MSEIKLLRGDCLELMKQIPDKSVDMVLCDLPYGTTQNKWDSVIDLKQLWGGYNRIIKDRGCIALFSQTPFDKILGASNLNMLKYEWIWRKKNSTGFLNANFAPMKEHENILIFSKSSAGCVKDKLKAMKYNPQKAKGKPYTAVQYSHSSNYGTQKENVISSYDDRFPKSILEFGHDKEKYHPTQKPVKLCEYLIKTYTDEGDFVLDNCMGSGSTGVACKNTNRNFIGIELDEKYFEIAKQRIENGFVQEEITEDELNKYPLFE